MHFLCEHVLIGVGQRENKLIKKTEFPFVVEEAEHEESEGV